MSEVKRYLINWHMEEEFEHSEGRFVNASDYDAAQSELAALREELAECQGLSSARFHALYAAEQRNAELTDILNKAIEWFDDGVGRSDEEFEMLQEMRAAIKPTESGASE